MGVRSQCGRSQMGHGLTYGQSVSASTQTWSGAFLLENNDIGDAYGATIAMDGSGNAIAVWQQWSGYNFKISINRYTASTDTWSGSREIAPMTIALTQNPLGLPCRLMAMRWLYMRI